MHQKNSSFNHNHLANTCRKVALAGKYGHEFHNFRTLHIILQSRFFKHISITQITVWRKWCFVFVATTKTIAGHVLHAKETRAWSK